MQIAEPGKSHAPLVLRLCQDERSSRMEDGCVSARGEYYQTSPNFATVVTVGHNHSELVDAVSLSP